jgi:hypothetical protein
MHDFALKLPAETLAALRRIAAAEDASVGQIIRDAITRDLRRRQRAKTAVRPDERLVAPLRALLADDLAYARGWEDLAGRLKRKGYRLQEAGGGLVLERIDGTRMCKASDLGYSYSRLLRRFDAPFPGHAHRWVLERQRAEARR